MEAAIKMAGFQALPPDTPEKVRPESIPWGTTGKDPCDATRLGTTMSQTQVRKTTKLTRYINTFILRCLYIQ